MKKKRRQPFLSTHNAASAIRPAAASPAATGAQLVKLNNHQLTPQRLVKPAPGFFSQSWQNPTSWTETNFVTMMLEQMQGFRFNHLLSGHAERTNNIWIDTDNKRWSPQVLLELELCLLGRQGGHLWHKFRVTLGINQMGMACQGPEVTNQEGLTLRSNEVSSVSC